MASNFVQDARKQGYSDDEILEYLSENDKLSGFVNDARQQGHSNNDILSYLDKDTSFFGKAKQNLKEIPTQGGKGLVSGLTGTYGDILDIAHAQPKQTLPGEQASRNVEFDILEKMQQPGYKPSAAELGYLSEDDVTPRYSRLPSSQESERFLEELGAPGEPETIAGRYASRGGKLVGSGLALGQGNVGTSLLAAGAGQSAEELGAPKWAQAAIELATFVKSHKGKTPITSGSHEIKSELDRLRKLGFTEEDLTLAKNALEEKNILGRVARPTKESTKRFQESAQSIEKNFNKLIEDAYPGLKEGGLNTLENAKDHLYDLLRKDASSVKIPNNKAFVDSSQKAIDRLKKAPLLPDEKAVVSFLEDSISQSHPELNADYYTEVFKKLNKLGKWGDPKTREYIISTVKNGIKDTFKANGKEGKEIGLMLDLANKANVKVNQASDILDYVAKATTDEGMNFAKMNKTLHNPDKYREFVKAIGKESTDNLRKISSIGDKIKDLNKTVDGGAFKKAFGLAKSYHVAKAIVTGDYKSLGAAIGSEASSRIATKFLTDPKYQNIQLKMLKALKEGKYDLVRVLSDKIDTEENP